MTTPNHPYTEFEETNLWKFIDKAIDDLIENQDIKLTTKKEYVVGYICKTIKEKNIDNF
jgi:hypothetical protein